MGLDAVVYQNKAHPPSDPEIQCHRTEPAAGEIMLRYLGCQRMRFAALASARVRTLALPPVHHQVGGGYQEHSQDNRRGQAADDRSRQGGVLLAAGSELQSHRQHAENRRQRRHKNRAQANAASVDDRVFDRFALPFQAMRKIHDQNTV